MQSQSLRYHAYDYGQMFIMSGNIVAGASRLATLVAARSTRMRAIADGALRFRRWSFGAVIMLHDCHFSRRVATLSQGAAYCRDLDFGSSAAPPLHGSTTSKHDDTTLGTAHFTAARGDTPHFTGDRGWRGDYVVDGDDFSSSMIRYFAPSMAFLTSLRGA